MDLTPRQAIDTACEAHRLFCGLEANLLRSKEEALKLVELLENELDEPMTPKVLLELANGLEAAAAAFRDLAREREGVR